MAESNGSLTPQRPDEPRGDQTGGRGDEFAELRAKIQAVAGFIRDLAERQARSDEEWRRRKEESRERGGDSDAGLEPEEYRRRMAEYDARYEEHQRRMKEQDAQIDELMRDNRRRIDELERRWGIGGSRDE